MKKLFFVLAFLLCFVTAASAQTSPILTCDPYPAGGAQPTSFVVTAGSTIYPDSPAKINADGTAVLWFNLSAWPNGSYKVVVQAKDSAGVSAASDPFSFSLPVPIIPAVPSGFTVVLR